MKQTPDDTVSLTVGGKRLSGWESLRVTRGIERVPSDFVLQVTETYPGEPDTVVIEPGAPCEVRIGSDLVLTGYVDRYDPSIGPRGHTVRLSGRSKCEDLVDCSLLFDGNQMSKVSVLDLARKLAEPYGVSVSAPGGPGDTVEQINFLLGETPYEVIERVARWSRLLAYDDTAGNLVLSGLGTEKHESGFRQGANVQEASANWSMDQRYAEYAAYIMSSNSLSDVGAALGQSAGAGNRLVGAEDPGAKALRRADGQPRLRRHAIISEQFDYRLGHIAEARAKWEMQRRWGRGQQVRLVCDGWRDAAGSLWGPNRIAVVHLPVLKVVEAHWLIAEVSYLKTLDAGTVAELLLMPPAAFEPEPTSIQPTYFDVARDVRDNPRGPDFNPRRDEPMGGA